LQRSCTVSLYVNEALPFQPLAAAASSKDRARVTAAHSAQSTAAADQAAPDAAQAESSGDTPAAADPLQDVIKKAVQAQVAALSEVMSCPPPLHFAPLFWREYD
jgi:hypothetical protein